MLIHPCHYAKAAALFTLSLAAVLSGSGQPQPTSLRAATSPSINPPTNTAGKLAFDAASVRPNTQNSSPKGMDFLNPASDASPPQGGLFSWNVQLPWLINFAYDLRSSQMRREAREALPRWAQNSWFAVEARAEGNPSRDDVRQMVRSLLEDRFHFAAHMGKRKGQVYALVLGRPGFAPKRHIQGTPCTLSSSQAGENEFPHIAPSYEVVPAHCGIFSRELSHGGDRRLEMLDVTMPQIASSLGLGLPLLVVDKTGMEGRYDVVVDFGPDDVSNTDASDTIGLPPLQGALEKQAGLKLIKQSAVIESFLIDHIEEDSGN